MKILAGVYNTRNYWLFVIKLAFVKNEQTLSQGSLKPPQRRSNICFYNGFSLLEFIFRHYLF